METIRTIFSLKIRAPFLIFKKEQGRPPLVSCEPVLMITLKHLMLRFVATTSINYTRLRGASTRTELLYQVTGALSHYFS